MALTMKKQRGFTLLEILISVGILMIVAILIVQVLFTTTHVNTKTEYLSDAKQNGNFALENINRMVRSAQTIQTSCGFGVTSASSVLLTNPDNSLTTFECLSDGTRARIASVSGNGVIVYLTAGNVTLSTSGGATCDDSSLVFSCPPASGIQNSLTFSFTLGHIGVAGSTYEVGTSSFQSTVFVRNW